MVIDKHGADAFDTPRRVERAAIIGGNIHAALRAKRGGRVLDYGCGTGLVSLPYATAYREVVLMDASPAMIDALTEKIARRDAPILRPVLCDLTRETYDGPFDAIYASMVLHHIGDLPGLLATFHAMLAPGGILCAADLDTDSGLFHAEEPDFLGHHGFCHADMRALLRGAGFAAVHVETFYHGAKEIRGIPHPYSLFLATGVKT